AVPVAPSTPWMKNVALCAPAATGSAIDAAPGSPAAAESWRRLPLPLVSVTVVPPAGATAPSVTVYAPYTSPLPTAALFRLSVIVGDGVTVTATASVAIDVID